MYAAFLGTAPRPATTNPLTAPNMDLYHHTAAATVQTQRRALTKMLPTRSPARALLQGAVKHKTRAAKIQYYDRAALGEAWQVLLPVICGVEGAGDVLVAVLAKKDPDEGQLRRCAAAVEAAILKGGFYAKRAARAVVRGSPQSQKEPPYKRRRASAAAASTKVWCATSFEARLLRLTDPRDAAALFAALDALFE